MHGVSQIDIHLGHLATNLAQWRRVLGSDCTICAVLKADGYGLGAVPIAKKLAAWGVSLLAVYNARQATQLAAAGVHCPLLVLMPVDDIGRGDVLYRAIVSGRLHLTVHTMAQLEHVVGLGRKFGTPVPVHLELDTGMSRMGATLDGAPAMLNEIRQRRYVKLAGLFTHPASPDVDLTFTGEQCTRFERFLQEHAALIDDDTAIHFAGTFAALRDRRYHKIMVRLGLGLFGYGVEGMIDPPMLEDPPALQPIMRWSSHIVLLRDVPAGTPVGYRRTYITDRPTRLGVVPVGYADGYPLALSNQAVVRVGEAKQVAPVRGLVNMDQIVIDVTEFEDIAVGNTVELYADDPQAPNAVPALAKLAGSNVYELLTRLDSRIDRHYITRSAVEGMARAAGAARP